MKLALRVVWVSWPQDSQTLENYPFTKLPSFPVQLTCGGEAMLLWITRCLGISTMLVLVHKLTPSYSQSQLFRKSFPSVEIFLWKGTHLLSWLRLTQKQIFVFTPKTPMQPKKSSSFDRWDKNMSQKCSILGYADLYPGIRHIEMGPKSRHKASQMCETSLAQGSSHYNYNMVINSWSGLVWESLHHGTVFIWSIPLRNAMGHVTARLTF